MFQNRHRTGLFRRAFIVCLALCGAQLAWSETAGAAGGTIRDGRDTKGALDIAAVTYATGGGETVTHTVRFYSPFKSSALKAPRAVLAFSFDTDGDKRSDHLAVVFFADHVLRAAVADSKGRILNVSRALRPDSRTIAVTFPARAFGEEGGYRWTALTVYKDRARCRRSCVDVAPNSGGALFDFTPPAIDIHTPDPYNLFTASTAFKVHLKVADKGFSGVRRWTLDERAAGQTDWATLASGAGDGEMDVPQTGVEGATYEYRVTAVDLKGNESVSTRLVSIPIDDANPLLENAYLGAGWDAYVNPGYQLFMHTAHRAGGIGVVFSYSFTGTYVAWLSGGGCCPRARVYIDDGGPRFVTVNNTWKPFELGGLAYGPHTIRIEPEGWGFEIDGIVTR